MGLRHIPCTTDGCRGVSWPGPTGNAIPDRVECAECWLRGELWRAEQRQAMSASASVAKNHSTNGERPLVWATKYGVSAMTEFITVPILRKFDHDDVIGELRIRADALPATSGFVFNIGYRALEIDASSGLATKYDLIAVSITDDDSYFAYLKQIGKT